MMREAAGDEETEGGFPVAETRSQQKFEMVEEDKKEDEWQRRLCQWIM